MPQELRIRDPDPGFWSFLGPGFLGRFRVQFLLEGHILIQFSRRSNSYSNSDLGFLADPVYSRDLEPDPGSKPRIRKYIK